MDEEEKRLNAMLAAKADALALRENLWRWPADLRAPSVGVPAEAGAPSPEEAASAEGQAPMREIRLDPRRTVREEMEALFHSARRGQRGLEHLAVRRAALREEAAALDRRAASVCWAAWARQRRPAARQARAERASRRCPQPCPKTSSSL